MPSEEEHLGCENSLLIAEILVAGLEKLETQKRGDDEVGLCACSQIQRSVTFGVLGLSPRAVSASCEAELRQPCAGIIPAYVRNNSEFESGHMVELDAIVLHLSGCTEGLK
jgi:hypothetical protein